MRSRPTTPLVLTMPKDKTYAPFAEPVASWNEVMRQANKISALMALSAKNS